MDIEFKTIDEKIATLIKKRDSLNKKLCSIEKNIRSLKNEKKKLIVSEKKYHLLEELKNFKGKDFKHITVIVQLNNGEYDFKEFSDVVTITNYGHLDCCTFSDEYTHFGFKWNSIFKCYVEYSSNFSSETKINIIGFYDLY